MLREIELCEKYIGYKIREKKQLKILMEYFFNLKNTTFLHIANRNWFVN